MKDNVILYCNRGKINHLVRFSNSHHFQIKKIIETSVSDNGIDWFELMTLIDQHEIQKIIIPNCTCLLFKISDFIGFVNDLYEKSVSLLIVDMNIESLDDDGTFNPVFRMLMDILDEFDLIQRQQTRDRLSTAFRLYICKGGKVGRKTGYRKKTMTYKSEYSRQLNLLKEGYSLKECRKITGTSINTLRKLKSMFL